MSRNLEFDWVEQKDTYRVGVGVLQTAGGEIDFCVKLPFEVVDSHPIVVSPGFTDSRFGTDRLTNYYAEQNRVGVTFSHPRDDHPEYDEDPEGHKADNIKSVVEALDDKKLKLKRKKLLDFDTVDMEGISEGAANGSRFAHEHPELVRTFISIAGGGLIKDDTLPKITSRAIKNSFSNIRIIAHLLTHPVHDVSMGRRTISYVFSNPSKAKDEALRTGAADIRSRYPVLSKFKQIPTGALQFLGDELFPFEMVMESTDEGRIFDIFWTYPDKKAGHFTPQHHPRRVGAQLLEMTAELIEISKQQQAA